MGSSTKRFGRFAAAPVLLLALLSALFAVIAAGCGSMGKAGGSSSSASSSAPTETVITTSSIPPGQRLRGDGDADNPGDIDGNGDVDGSKDVDSDYPVPASYKFPDEDDTTTFAYGHPAGAGDQSAIASVVKRYYADASTGSGADACSLLLPALGRAVPEDYGSGAGPTYLRGGKTCPQVTETLFKHLHGQLAEAVTVVEVRVEGSKARVVLGSRAMPASYIDLIRAGGAWRILELLGQPLP